MITTHECYYPLYNDKEHFIIIVTGGRGSGKSFSVGTFLERLTFEKNKLPDGKSVTHNILSTRYTMTSASISVIPEFLEKVDADGTSRYFHSTKTDITNVLTGAKVMFRGIKTSSGNQTAKLKSIQGITTFVCDEAEEWTSEEEFEKIMFSIRQQGIQNRIIVIMNPTDSNHFIYQKYIKDTHKIVEYDGVPVQISTHPSVLHIHTSYLDNMAHLSEEFIKEAQAMKENDPERYAHIFMGQWSDVAEGAVFKKWGIVDEFPEECRKVAIGADWGFTNDPSTGIRCGVIDNRLYLDELYYEKGMLSSDITKELLKHGLKVIADSADPRLIQEVANGGILIYPVMKGAGSIMAGIDKMLTMEIYVTKRSVNLQEELRNYTWDKDMNGNYINKPIDAYNHCFIGSTKVRVRGGWKRIDEIQVGDEVLTSDGYHFVTKFFDNGELTVQKNTIHCRGLEISVTCTKDHKVKTINSWKEIRDVKRGDVVYTAMNGRAVPRIVTSVERCHSRRERVYDIEVMGNHEFFANGLLVHNCIDAARYYVLGELLGQIMLPKKIDTSHLGIF